MKKVITAFKEHKEFKEKKPWDATVMDFPADKLIPPHYAETIEVLLCCNISGDIHIGGKHFDINDKQVFFIPPNTVHSINYKKNNGVVTVLKINPEQFKPAIDLDAILSYSGLCFADLPVMVNEYDKIELIANTFINSSSPTKIISSIIELIEILISHTKAEMAILQKHSNNDELRKILLWSEEHFNEKVSLDDVSSLVGYDKHYFCNKFKSLTGITYLNYLNTLRIHHACTLLKSGKNIKTICDECGFENTSYFIQLFKKTIGTTPKKYSSE